MSQGNKLLVNEAFFDVIKKNLSQAKERIYIIIYNWHFYQNDFASPVSQINQIIFEKVRLGLDVRVIVGNKTLNNQLKERNINVRYNRLRGLNHAKVVIVDNYFCSVGSHNFSNNAFSRNEEATIVSDDVDLIKQCEAYFDSLFVRCENL